MREDIFRSRIRSVQAMAHESEAVARESEDMVRASIAMMRLYLDEINDSTYAASAQYLKPADKMFGAFDHYGRQTVWNSAADCKALGHDLQYKIRAYFDWATANANAADSAEYEAIHRIYLANAKVQISEAKARLAEYFARDNKLLASLSKADDQTIPSNEDDKAESEFRLRESKFRSVICATKVVQHEAENFTLQSAALARQFEAMIRPHFTENETDTDEAAACAVEIRCRNRETEAKVRESEAKSRQRSADEEKFKRF